MDAPLYVLINVFLKYLDLLMWNELGVTLHGREGILGHEEC